MIIGMMKRKKEKRIE